MNFRVSAIGEIEKPALKEQPLKACAVLPEPQEVRKVLFVGKEDYLDTPVYGREDFVPGLAAEGPMIIEQMDCTTVIPPGWKVRVDGYLNLHVEQDGGGKS